MFKLIIEDDEGKTTVVPIMRDEITIGRKEGNNIRLTERNVSRSHARISRSDADVFIEDLDSYNGIRINGDRIQVKTAVHVNEGDLIEIGDYHLAIQLEGSEGAGLAGSQQGLDESTQRVTMAGVGGDGVPPPSGTEEVTSQVLMPPQHHGEDVSMDEAPHAPPVAEPTARVQMPSPNEETPDPEAPARRPEPTAIIRTSDIPPPQAAPAASHEHARLVVVSTGLAGQAFNLLKDETVIGRTDDNDLVLDHRSVSRNHAKIVKADGRYSVVDLNSANGVLVNGEEYKRMDLRKGDIIELGHVKLRFVDPGEKFSLTPEEIDRLRREEEAANEALASGDSTGVVKGRPGGGGRPLPVKAIAIGVGALVLVLGGGVGALMCGKDSGGARDPKNPPVAQQDDRKPPRPPPEEKKPPPEEKKPPPEEKKPPPEEKKPPPPPPREDKAELQARLVKQGKDAMRAGDFVKAREAFDQASEDPEARRGLDQVERELKAKGQLDEALARRGEDPNGALRALKAVQDGTRARTQAAVEIKALRMQMLAKWLKDGEKALQAGDHAAAKQYAEDVLEEDKGNKDGLKLAEKAAKARKAALSAKSPQGNKPPPPNNTPAENSGGSAKADARKALDEGNHAVLMGNFDEAVAKGKLALKLDSSLTEAHKLLGVAYARIQKYCDAKTHYKKYIEANPNSTQIDRIKAILQGPELQSCQ
jgi:pSer/pThr/pTyr-binding forkhead associated (FHA) protein/tetratricopeptide (TPR) repeat protein